MPASLVMLAVAGAALAQDLPLEVTLFKNVNVFDGTSDQLLEDHDVLVVRNMIKKDAWLGIQPFPEVDPSQLTLPPETSAKWSETVKGFENAIDLAAKHDLNR